MGQLKKPGNPQAYGYVAADTILNGAFACWDPTATAYTQTGANGAARPLHAGIGSSGAFFLGVFQATQPIASGIDNAAPLAPPTRLTVQREGIFPFLTTPSETYVHGTVVYAPNAGDANGQDFFITTVSSGNTKIGYINLPGGESVTGAAGLTIDVELTPDTTKQSAGILSA